MGYRPGKTTCFGSAWFLGGESHRFRDVGRRLKRAGGQGYTDIPSLFHSWCLIIEALYPVKAGICIPKEDPFHLLHQFLVGACSHYPCRSFPDLLPGH